MYGYTLNWNWGHPSPSCKSLPIKCGSYSTLIYQQGGITLSMSYTKMLQYISKCFYKKDIYLPSTRNISLDTGRLSDCCSVVTVTTLSVTVSENTT